ncbi:serine/threonine-protein kinase [Streptomyces sp. NPDC048636]|uniref:serine/threonine-protein kinase n=1 Tax=Streptomyces sp. NPDC048636 TaxID=3155762 RepID=UPI0034291733
MGEIFAGRYELVDPIGRGGVGAVWRAWDHRRRRYVAAKVLQQRDAHTLLRFVREQALRIDHPHVLAPASWAADDDKVLFTMDLVGGGSFAHLIGDYGPLPPRYVCTLLDQLLSGLAAVHAEGVVHRDIKPANILLEATGTRRPHVRLSDFGIALTKGEPRLTEANYVMGTPGYFAPEQMMGEDPDFPADLFAVGLVALYLLSGHKPDAEALVKRFSEHGVPNPPAEVPEPLWQVVAGLLQPDPEDRFRTAIGARKALATAVESLPEVDFDDETIEIFDQLGPLPTGFGSCGPTHPRPRHAKADSPAEAAEAARTATTAEAAHVSRPAAEPEEPAEPAPPQPSMSDTGSFTLPPPRPQPHTPSQPREQHAAPAHPPVQGPLPPQHPPTPHPLTPHPPVQRPSLPQPPVSHPPVPHPHIPQTPSTVAPRPQAPHTPQTPQTPQPPVQPPLAGHHPEPPGSPHPHTPTPVPIATPSAAPLAHPPTRPYTAQQPRVPHRAARRPGPSRKATVSILVAAAVCFAVGAWALLLAG